MGQSKCQECKKPIKWIQTVTGKWMPCDTERIYYIPDPGSSDILVLSNGKSTRGRIVTKEESRKFGFRAHWATCTKYDYFRRMQQERREREERAIRGIRTTPSHSRHPSIEGNKPEEPVMEQFSIL